MIGYTIYLAAHFMLLHTNQLFGIKEEDGRSGRNRDAATVVGHLKRRQREKGVEGLHRLRRPHIPNPYFFFVTSAGAAEDEIWVVDGREVSDGAGVTGQHLRLAIWFA